MNRFTFLKTIKFQRPSLIQIAVIAAGILVALGGYFFMRGLVTCWTITQLAGKPPSSCGTVTEGLNAPDLTNSEGTPIPNVEELPPPPITVPDSNLPPAWDGASRINILIIGLDYRDWVAGEGAPRSDTMIVLTVDPLAKTAGILSIPRDLWVNIPGFGYSRINTAYSSGEGAKLPGGGPELARKTVEQLLGVPIQYFAQVDFYTFVEFIDMIGGIEIYNEEDLRLDPVGAGKDKIRITCCGMRHLGGERALAYVRFRKDKEGDIARANRQQKVILAIRDKVLSPENFPVLIGQAQQFYEKLSAGIRTNMPFDVAVRLGVLAKDIPVQSIQHGVIDYSMVALVDTQLGGEKASVMKPLPDKIRELRDQIFTVGGAISPLAAQNDLTTMMREDTARVRVLNGSVVGGLESTTSNFLIAQGVQVTEAGPADGGYNSTVIVLYSPKLYTMKYFQSLFGITESTRIWISPNPSSTVDVEVRLGNDWANNNPMP
jgi:polyisoprenyl-teichoic acid--peptidoglycan teichoic acid transferase